MKIDWLDSIQTRLFVILIGATSIFFTGFMCLQYHTARKSMTAELNELADFMAGNLAGSLIIPLWDFDTISAKGILEAANVEKQLIAIFVRNKEDLFYGRIRNERWRMIDSQTPLVGNAYVHRTRKVFRKGKIIGSIDLYLTPEFMKKTIRNTKL